MAEQERAFVATLAIDGADYRIASLRGRLAISERFRFDVMALGPVERPAAEDILGKTFTLALRDPFGTTLSLGGVVGSVERDSGDAERSRYALELCPAFEALAVGLDSRGFQEVSAIDAARAVIDGGAVAAEWRLGGSYAKRPWIVQYRESDWTFVERLLGEEGLAYFVDTTSDDGTLVILDDTTTADPIEGGDAISFVEASGLDATKESVHEITTRTRVASGAVVLRDYDPRKPKVLLESKATDGDEADLEMYDWRGRFDETTVGDQRAQRRLESLRARRRVVSGRAGGLRLRPGRRMTIEDHPLPSLADPLLVVALDIHLAGQLQSFAFDDADIPAVSIRWEAIPIDAPFRPECPAPRTPSGVQTAVVVGPAGKEIHPDDIGRIRAQFRWDRLGKRDDKASVWQRVGQFPLGGSMIHPRVGWDVLCGFEEGDVDRPWIIQHVYDGEHPVPYPLPANKTRTAFQTATTPGGGSTNEIRFEDGAGSEEMFVNASMDQNVVVGNDASDKTGVDETRDIGGNETISIGSNEKLTVGSNETVSIGGDETVTVSGKNTLEIGGAQSRSIGGSRTAIIALGTTLETSSSRTLTVGGSMIGASASEVDRSTLGTASVTVGGAWVQAAADGVSQTTLGACAETIGGAKIMASGDCVKTTGKGALAETVGGAYVIAAGGNVGESASSTLRITVGGAFVANAPEVLFEATGSISMRVGGTTLKITPGSIELKSPAIAHPGASIGGDGSTINHN